MKTHLLIVAAVLIVVALFGNDIAKKTTALFVTL
jgi:hypothetical protein